jgi:hypothetical protein
MTEKKSGIIYELRANIDDEWHPFYVGQTNNAKRRIGEHRNDAKNATDESTLVYRNIKTHLNANDIEWNMFEVDEFNENSPADLEDEHIVRLLLEGAKLWNSKKGSPNWLADRQAAADDMRVRGVTSYRKYREILSLEEHNRQIMEQNEQRIQEELERSKITEIERRRQEQLDFAQQLADKLRAEKEQTDRQAALREKARKQKEQLDRAAREQRIKEETLRLRAEELERQQAVLSMRELTGAANRDTEETLELKSQIKLLGGYLETITTMWNPNAKHASTLEQHNQQIDYVSNRIKELTGELKLKTQEMEHMNIRVKELSKQLEQNK